MANYQQGDQYSLPIKITQNGRVITPSDAEDIRVKIADTVFSYLSQQHPVTYDTENQQWLVYLTEEFTRTLSSSTPIQVGIRHNNDIIYGPVSTLSFDTSLITEDWIA